MEIATQAQHRHDVTVSPEKRAAKQRAAEIIREFSPSPNPKILDIGGERFYAEFFPPMTQLNLPNDMHDLSSFETYDVIVAMHVLEHSPFPLVVLLNVWHALRPNGLLYVAVPRPVEPFLSMSSHFTVLAKEGWEKLFQHAGFDVEYTETGRFGNYDPAVEDRFVCIKLP